MDGNSIGNNFSRTESQQSLSGQDARGTSDKTKKTSLFSCFSGIFGGHSVVKNVEERSGYISITGLPHDVLSSIFQYTSLADRIALQKTCKVFSDVCNMREVSLAQVNNTYPDLSVTQTEKFENS